MSNLEVAPSEVLCHATDPEEAVELIEPREVPLGGPRAMRVRRTLPTRGRTMIGAFCFVDHYGPDRVAETGGMVVPPHPHTGLQTVSWLFEGEIEHRDSLGTVAQVVPGEVNLMTAGHGISHSEVSTGSTDVLHGVQLWLALPAGARDRAAAFESRGASRAQPAAGVDVAVFLGGLSLPAGELSTDLSLHTPLVAAEITLTGGAEVELPVDSSFEHGVLVDRGSCALGDEQVPVGTLAYAAPGRVRLSLRAGPEGARVLLLGGTPFAEQIVMWWNFIGRSHDEVVQARTQWMAGLEGGDTSRFGSFPYDGQPLAAPALPQVRLKPRG